MSQRLTGFSPVVRQRIKERAGTEGDFTRCEFCGRFEKYVQLHHRRPRGMGSSKRPDSNDASNGVALCMADHAWCEDWRTDAYKLGWLVPQHRTPSEIPVHMWDGCYLLSPDGERYIVPCRHEEAA